MEHKFKKVPTACKEDPLHRGVVCLNISIFDKYQPFLKVWLLAGKVTSNFGTAKKILLQGSWPLPTVLCQQLGCQELAGNNWEGWLFRV